MIVHFSVYILNFQKKKKEGVLRGNVKLDFRQEKGIINGLIIFK